MPELNTEEVQELLVGTWIGVALIADMLIENTVLSKEELLWTLSQIEEAASDNRRTALAGLRRLISRGFECIPSLDPMATDLYPPRSGCPSRCHWSPLIRSINARSYSSDTADNFRAFINISVDKRHRKR